MGDYYGRRPVFLAGLIGNFVIVVVLMVSTNLWIDLVMFFGLGLSITARYYVGYTYNVEL